MTHPPLAVAVQVAAIAAVLAGCLETPSLAERVEAGPGAPPDTAPPTEDTADDPSGDAAPPPAIVALEVLGADGRAHARMDTPRRPVLALGVSGEVWGTPEPVFLLEGEADERLHEDLEAPPLRVATLARSVPLVVERPGSLVRATPVSPLTPGARYVLAVGGWAGDGARRLDAPFVVELAVPSEGAGAALVDAWPGDGTAGVPTNLPMLAVRFDDDVQGAAAGVSLSRDGDRVATGAAPLPCGDVGWPRGSCLALVPAAPLAPGATHTVQVDASVLDRHGAPIGPAEVRFTTAADGGFLAPTLAETACGLDEVAIPPACALTDDRSVVVRARATGPVRAFLETPFGTRATVAPRGDVLLALGPLGPSTAFEARLLLVDLAGALTTVPLGLATSPPLPAVGIVEVRADPLGPEPRQEYVEVLNSGAVSVDLEGLRLSDRADREGDALPAGHVLGAGARALLVADDFDPEHPDDVAVPAGVTLVRIGASLASGGLSNAGEPLYLRDPAGRRLSGAPAIAVPPGTCLVRVSPDPRDGRTEAFAPGPCTPGEGPTEAR